MKMLVLTGLLIATTVLSTGCGPVKIPDMLEIKANETAWLIPLDAQSQAGQVKFNSVGFLDQKKVASKRVMIDKVQRTTGRAPWDYEWIPAARLIKVDRSLVTREWTDGDNHPGTAKGMNQGITVVTKDSIQLTVGLTITASIEEDDASTYLYYHGEKSLSDVIDQNIRSYAVAELTRKYSELALSDAQTNGTAIYAALAKDATSAFKLKGISIQFMGNAEGLEYKDPKVQESINKSFIIEQDQKTAKMEQIAQTTRNETLVKTAEATADAAKKMFDASQASELQNRLQIDLLLAKAQFQMASNWDGKLPANILPSNSPLLLNLGTVAARPSAITSAK